MNEIINTDLYNLLISDPILSALAIQGITSIAKIIITPKTWKRIPNLVKKLKDKNKNLELNLIPEERKIKIINFLLSTVEDEDFNLKEKGYLFDLENLIKDKNYIPIFNKINWDDLISFEKIGKNFNEIKNDKEFETLLKIGLKVWPYAPLILSYVINNAKELHINKMPISLQDIKTKNFWNIKKDATLEEKYWKFCSHVNFNEEKDWILTIFNKFENLNLIKLGHMPIFHYKDGRTQLTMFTQKNYTVFLTTKGQECLKLITK